MSPHAPAAWPDLGGRLVENTDGVHHVLPVRVYFEDTDFSGLVYHASYVRWCERGRSDYLRLVGNDHRALIAGSGSREPAAFVVRRMGIEFLKPGRIDDVLEVITRVTNVGAAALTLDQRIMRTAPDAAPVVLMTAQVLVVLVSQTGKVLRLSGLLRQALSHKSQRPV